MGMAMGAIGGELIGLGWANVFKWVAESDQQDPGNTEYRQEGKKRPGLLLLSGDR